MKKYLLYLLAALVPVVLIGALFPEKISPSNVAGGPAYVSTPGADIVTFVRDGCPHCAAFEAFVKKEGWEVEFHEITQGDAPELFKQLQSVAPLLQQGVPTIVINGHIVQGYDTDEKTGATLKKLYQECHGATTACLPFEELLKNGHDVPVTSAAEAMCTEKCESDESQFLFNIPFIGEVNLLDYTLPSLSIILGLLDGFNPCAMWVLITLLTLLINTRDMRKVWLIGGTFLFVSGAIYYLFIAAWLNVFLLIGFNFWVEKLIGLVAIAGGSFYLYEAFSHDPNACKVTDMEKRQRTIERMKKVLEASAIPAMMFGVAVLAVSVNMIELVCTAGIPAVFAKILAFNEVSHFMKHMYLLLYIIMYMLDDMIVFGIAVYTLQATGITTRYRRATMIFGGVLMYVLGMLLIFWPDALTFA